MKFLAAVMLFLGVLAFLVILCVLGKMEGSSGLARRS